MVARRAARTGAHTRLVIVTRTDIAAVERITGLEVVEVNVAVNDVHLPEDDARPAGETRVA